MGALEQLQRAAEQTPAHRERHVDLIRAVSIGAVVLGHWLVTAVTRVEDRIDGVNALAVIEWAHPLTWLFQVMPLFFFIGGYANAAALASHERKGGDALGWIIGRYDRLLRPTAALIVVIALSVVVVRSVGVGEVDAATAAWFATVPLWFLLAYLAVVAIAPLALRMHRRFGLRVVAALIGVVALGDLARLVLELPWVGDINYLAVWVAVHQLGFAWRDGRLPARPAFGAALAGTGLVALLALTVFGPYPISMVGVPGEDVQNTAPPTLALLALALVQIGLALGLRDVSSRWLQRRRVWMGVIAVNSVILTVFLWHMAAAIIATVVLYPTGVLPVVPLDTGTWWVLRIPWIATCLVALALLAAAFGRVELAVPGARQGARVAVGALRWLAVTGTAAVLLGMLSIATAGRDVHGPLGLPTEAYVSFAVGTALLAVVGRRTFET